MYTFKTELTEREVRFFQSIALKAGYEETKEERNRANALISNETSEIVDQIAAGSSRGAILAKFLLWLDYNYLPLETRAKNIILKKEGAMFSYLKAGEQPTIENNIYMRAGRAEAKILKVLNSFPFMTDFDQHSAEGFLNAIKSIQEGAQLTFKIVRGRKLAEVYTKYKVKFYNHKYVIGTPLKSSCMNNKKDIFGLYSNHKTCSMLILINDKGILFGRALLWQTEQGINFMDRIYSDDSKELLFISWAKDNGYFRRSNQNADHNPNIVGPDDNVHNISLTVKCKDIETLANFPYLDTFVYASARSGRVSNKRLLDSTHILTSTSGTYSTAGQTIEAYNKEGNCGLYFKHEVFKCIVDSVYYTKDLKRTCYYTGAEMHEKHAIKTRTGRTSWAQCPEVVYSKVLDEYLTLAQSTYSIEEKSFILK